MAIMFLKAFIGAAFVIGGLLVAVVSYFGGLFDPSGAPPNWPAYVLAAVAIGIGVAIIVR